MPGALTLFFIETLTPTLTPDISHLTPHTSSFFRRKLTSIFTLEIGLIQ